LLRAISSPVDKSTTISKERTQTKLPNYFSKTMAECRLRNTKKKKVMGYTKMRRKKKTQSCKGGSISPRGIQRVMRKIKKRSNENRIKRKMLTRKDKEGGKWGRVTSSKKGKQGTSQIEMARKREDVERSWGKISGADNKREQLLRENAQVKIGNAEQEMSWEQPKFRKGPRKKKKNHRVHSEDAEPGEQTSVERGGRKGEKSKAVHG